MYIYLWSSCILSSGFDLASDLNMDTRVVQDLLIGLVCPASALFARTQIGAICVNVCGRQRDVDKQNPVNENKAKAR